MIFLVLDVVAAWLLDCLLGDPHGLPHPVNAIGRLIGFLDRRWHPGPAATPIRAFSAGLALAVVVILLTAGLAMGLVMVASLIHPVVMHLVVVYLLYAALAGRCLELEARKVLQALRKSDAGIDPARQALSMLVSRDTRALDEAAIVRATVETVAENTVDGVLAPLFWIFVGLSLGSIIGGSLGPLVLAVGLVWAFKAASTMDSRIAYQTERYRFFGRAAARIDDAFNFVPARLSLILLSEAALFCRLDWKAAWRLGRRDRLKHASPNSAHPESAVAGALGIRLGGPAIYHGKLEDKPALGDERRAAEPADILAAVRLMHVSALVLMGLAGGLLMGIFP